ncbi:hypothetical protein L6452_04145 [Arctium lappa]|uniref:Uncharacterized protein n=1 Tax=Arctium lappa TaxID=4217 RepID=A0ACB9FNU8_ARCLA|nr:hypothetical protein L6452_04145 [Arctium lappa]
MPWAIVPNDSAKGHYRESQSRTHTHPRNFRNAFIELAAFLSLNFLLGQDSSPPSAAIQPTLTKASFIPKLTYDMPTSRDEQQLD